MAAGRREVVDVRCPRPRPRPRSVPICGGTSTGIGSALTGGADSILSRNAGSVEGGRSGSTAVAVNGDEGDEEDGGGGGGAWAAVRL